MSSFGAETGSAQASRLEDLNRETRRIRTTMEGATGTAESSDGLVEATVGVYGELVDLVLDARIYRMPDAEVLAEQIRTVINDAHSKAQDAVRTKLTDLFPMDLDGPEEFAFEPFLRMAGRSTEGGAR
ncbi:YbaB/EbfC DNA-binding family protein [Kribbella sp. VKM Ac-2569]|uniref:YbaB/EbfC family nucleoid-associated protein n=1 Tax=Kribbella sp. VKM Ac-2569 TaxID=2512220 RepID=UPI00102B7577|nr:YbaB/EbfC family nucleoid-associated protein [Kribbella sp. VKM Ac-2569]RZT07852.1 YbaB/EbfC DNA-binding family protein [Kribbella sp. VKM Ac-2569]